MKIETLANLISTDEFESKDKKKKFHHATFLVGDLTIKCMFIKQDDYNILCKLSRLHEVNICLVPVANGTDNNGNTTYGFRLEKVIWNVKQ